MSFPTPIPVEIPDPPAEPTQPLPPVGSTVTYTLSVQDLDLIETPAPSNEDEPSAPVYAEGDQFPGNVTARGTGTQLTIRVLLTEDGTTTIWALLRPEGTTPGTWSRPTP
ncbi:hypothetical protein ACIOHC_30580 [Streptomyces sp. NPDC088252]|uniref:hypothetical protein n=1 Tax=unclassified Streptomyces TaxID=2593676 RepID=UPI0038126427